MRSAPNPSVEEREEFGRSLRKRVPRKSHAELLLGATPRDPVGLLEEQNQRRLQALVPVRRSRMSSSPFAFFRGAARVMASDLSRTAVTGVTVQACGDAHLANFGLYASPERRLVFDLNDFDETLEGPWEWDVKRLAASFTIAARHNQLDANCCGEATAQVARSYRQAMHEFAAMRTTDVWYAYCDEQHFASYAESGTVQRRVRKTIAKAKTKHSLQALDRLAEKVDGENRIKAEPPLLYPLRELEQELAYVDETLVREAYAAYTKSVTPDCAMLLKKFCPVDIAVKVVGVGSVGTRCWVLLLEGRDPRDPLFLQIKEATQSVLAEHLPPSPYENQGRRVVEGQRLMQTATDIFLGWMRTPKTGHDFYWRQLRDWKGSVNMEGLSAEGLKGYASACGWTLARAHARSGDPIAIASYLGTSDSFDLALMKFGERYADQNERDYNAFLAEVRSGRLEVSPDLC